MSGLDTFMRSNFGKHKMDKFNIFLFFYLCRKSMSSSYLCELRVWNCSILLPCAISGTNIGIFYGLLSGLLMLLMPCLCGLLLLQLLRLLHSSVVLLMRILQ